MTEEAYPDALPVGHRLHWYVLEHVLGQGGFGITYLAHDTNLDRRVAIKEYLPSDIARRRSDAAARPSTESHAERYAWGLERFLSEARTLARFDHPNVVRVYSVFEANNTAYMVMRYEEGEALSTLLERSGTLPEQPLVSCLLAILDGLQLVHDSGFIHRDIKPENVYIRRDGSPVLLDFGSARQSFGSTKTMTILVAPGYAPLEQYYGDAETQGPWTDIYGLGATCYRAIVGKAPVDAIVRAKGVLGSAREVLQPAVEAGRGRYSERLLAAVDHALQLNDRDRPQRIADWRLEIADPPVPAVARTSAPAAPTTVPGGVPHSARSETELHAAVPMWRSPLVRNLLAMAGAVAAVSSFVINALRSTPPPMPTPSPAPTLQFVTPPAPVLRQEPIAQEAVPIKDTVLPSTKTVSSTPRAPYLPPERDARSTVRLPGNLAIASSAPGSELARKPTEAGSLPTTAPPQAPVRAPTDVALAPTTAPPVTHDNPAPNKLREVQLGAAEAAIQRGDGAAAAEILKPLAATGLPRAQALLGRANGQQQNDLQAYFWYGVAARGGEPGAQALQDKVAQKLQPAEIRQADRSIENWKPKSESAASAIH